MFLFMFHDDFPLVFVVCFEDEQGSSWVGQKGCVFLENVLFLLV